MKKVVIKLIIIVITIAMLLSNINAFATSKDAPQFSIDDFENGSAGKAETITTSALENVLAVTKVVTAGIALIMLTILAMKYMLSAPGERAEIKKHAVVYIVGAVIMLASSGLLSILEGFAGNLSE